MAVRVQPRQLAFALPHAESLTRDNFLEGPANESALALIESWPDWPNRIMLLVGPEGSGKSHLAAIWAETTGARVLAAKLLGDTDLPGALAIAAKTALIYLFLVVGLRLLGKRELGQMSV